jgi:lipopolysaccharide export system permease protein
MKLKLKPGIIDRYMLRQFIQTFAICFISLTGLYIVFDGFTNLEKFIECAEQNKIGLFSLIASYYSYQTLFFFDLTAAMLAMTAAMFTITWIQRHNEMTALLAAGVSRIRVAMPVVIAAGVVALLGTANRELIMPHFRFELNRTPYDLLGNKDMAMYPRMDGVTNILIDGSKTVASQRKIISPNFIFPTSISDYCEQITASEAFYQKAKGDLPAGYILKGVQEPKDLDEKPSLEVGGLPVVITPHDRPDLLKSHECFVASDVDLDMIITKGAYASTVDLVHSLHNPSLALGRDVETGIHARILRPFSDLTLLFLGLPLVLTRDNRNIFVAIGLCVLVVSIFVIFSMSLQGLATSHLISPHFAVWAPLFIFVPIAVWMGHKMVW